MVALNFQQVNLLFSYYGSAVTHGYRLSVGGSQFPTGQPLLFNFQQVNLFFSYIYSHGSAVALVMPTVKWWLSVSHWWTYSSHIFPWIRCCPGLQVVRRCLSVSNGLTSSSHTLPWICCYPGHTTPAVRWCVPRMSALFFIDHQSTRELRITYIPRDAVI
jgi:hypothetical protein